MFKKGVCILLIVSFSFVSSGCCTLVKGNNQTVTINSEPEGAKVRINGLKGKTPYTVSLSRNKEYIATISKEGYETEQVQIQRNFGALAIFGNLFFLLIGAIVDLATGSAYNLNPASVNVELEKIETPQTELPAVEQGQVQPVE